MKQSQRGASMQKVGWVATGLAILWLLTLAALLVSSLPELRRYLKMETM